MSNNILITYYEVSNTLYVIIRNEIGKVWNTSSQSFVDWNDSNIANYVVNATYKNGSLYIAEFPTSVLKGYYTVMIFLQGGVSPDFASDIWLGTSEYYWDKDNENLVGVRADALIEYSSGERFSEKALENSKKISIDHDTDSVVIERMSSSS